ncbi:MAG: hypothetical protein HKN23_04530 [Verrucomicrobiales bacterium]|nr:hypothetical protein [Verrucomicrobiales bacterium]
MKSTRARKTVTALAATLIVLQVIWIGSYLGLRHKYADPYSTPFPIRSHGGAPIVHVEPLDLVVPDWLFPVTGVFRPLAKMDERMTGKFVRFYRESEYIIVIG